MKREFDELPSVPDDLLLAILEGADDDADERIALLMEARVMDAYAVGQMAGEKRAANHRLKNKYMEEIAAVLRRWAASLHTRAKTIKKSDAA